MYVAAARMLLSDVVGALLGTPIVQAPSSPLHTLNMISGELNETSNFLALLATKFGGLSLDRLKLMHPLNTNYHAQELVHDCKPQRL